MISSYVQFDFVSKGYAHLYDEIIEAYVIAN